MLVSNLLIQSVQATISIFQHLLKSNFESTDLQNPYFKLYWFLNFDTRYLASIRYHPLFFAKL